MFLIISYGFAILYFILIFRFFAGLLLPARTINASYNTFSIIVAARNEAANLTSLLELLLQQNYPPELYEIIVTDDRSEDKTFNILQEYCVKYDQIKIAQIVQEDPNLVGKKGALTAAIKLATNDILAFTDADCEPTAGWLHAINKAFKPDTDFVAGYSYLTMANKFFEKLKNLERSAIFAIAAGSIGWNKTITCAASNIAYRRELFHKIDGFTGIGHLRSGDDDLMLQKLAPHLRRKAFLFSPDSIIKTKGSENTNQQVNLETRRASKFKHYPIHIKALTLCVFLFYIVYLFQFIASVAGLVYWSHFALITAIKIVPEFLLLLTFLLKIKRTDLMKYFLLVEFIYIPYFVIFGLKGTFGKYKWKE